MNRLTLRPSGSRTAVPALIALVLALTPVPGAAAEQVSAALASKIILKILLLDQELDSKTGGGVVVGVIGSDAAYRAFSGFKGQQIDRSHKVKIADVVRYDSLPSASARPTVLFVGERANPAEALAFTRAHDVLSATNVVGYVERGITVGVTAEGNKPRVMLNLVGSEQEGISWNPKILKIAKTVR